MKELYGGDLSDFFKNTGISAKCTYQKENEHEGMLEIWEVSDNDYEKMCNMTEEEFKNYTEDGWWRSASGSNMGIPNEEYEINGHKILAWDGIGRQTWCDRRYDFCKDCKGDDNELIECFGDRKYSDLLTYLCDEVGASQPGNVCALATDLAKYNNMTVGELFEKLQ